MSTSVHRHRHRYPSSFHTIYQVVLIQRTKDSTIVSPLTREAFVGSRQRYPDHTDRCPDGPPASHSRSECVSHDINLSSAYNKDVRVLLSPSQSDFNAGTNRTEPKQQGKSFSTTTGPGKLLYQISEAIYTSLTNYHFHRHCDSMRFTANKGELTTFFHATFVKQTQERL